MNYRKLILFSFIGIAFFFWFSLKQKKNEISRQKINKEKLPSVSNDQQPESKDQKLAIQTKAEIADPDGLSKCYRKIWHELKVEECDVQCFANYVDNHDPDLAKLINERWTDKSVSERKAYSQLGLFLRSLQNAGMKFEPLAPEKTDLDMALAQISQLSSDDPGNGYPLLFTSLLYKLKGRDEEAGHYLRAASEAPRFDSYIGKIGLRLRMAASDDPKMHLKAITLYSQLPFPDYRKLEELVGVDDNALGIVLQKMTSKGQEVGGKGFSLNWEPLEHQTAIFILRKFSPNEAEKIPSYRDIIERDNSLGTGYHWQFDEKSCKKEDFIEELQREKLFLQTLN